MEAQHDGSTSGNLSDIEPADSGLVLISNRPSWLQNQIYYKNIKKQIRLENRNTGAIFIAKNTQDVRNGVK